MASSSSVHPVFPEPRDAGIYDILTKAAGPPGRLPLDADFLRTAPSGDLFGLTMDAGMGWPAERLRRSGHLAWAVGLMHDPG